MTFSELETAVRHLLDEEVVANSHWSSTRLKLWINEAQVDIARRLPAPLLTQLAETDKQNLAAGQAEYIFDKEFLKISNIIAYSRNAPILPLEYINAFSDNANYIPTTTNPFTNVFGQTVTVYPTPIATIINGLVVYYIRPPADMVNNGDLPEVPEFTHRWIVTYAVYKAYTEDGDSRAATLYNEYLERFGAGMSKGG